MPQRAQRALRARRRVDDLRGGAHRGRARRRHRRCHREPAWPRRTHGLAILADEISDHPENLTRFVSLARFTRLDHDAHTEWHTALRLITKHEPGALHSAIEPLRYHDVQMTSLHSRPIMGEPWRYQFYIDVVGHRSATRVLRALKDVSERSAELHVLGSYPVSRGVQ